MMKRLKEQIRGEQYKEHEEVNSYINKSTSELELGLQKSDQFTRTQRLHDQQKFLGTLRTAGR